MSKNSKLKYLLLIIFSFFSIYSFADSKTVRVGYFNGQERFQSGFSDYEHKSGYAYEYFQDVARITGFRYKYIYGSLDEIYKLLEEGKIDVVAGVSKNPEREETLCFPHYEMGIEKTYICIPSSDSAERTLSIQLLSGRRLGVVKGTTIEGLVKKFKNESGLDFQIVYFDNPPELMNAFINGDINASPMLNSHSYSNVTPLVVIGECPIYFAVNKNRPDIAEDFNYAQQIILKDSPFYHYKLQEKYFFEPVQNYELSETERSYLAGKKLRIGCLSDMLPYCHVDSNGHASGAVEVLEKHFENFLNVPVEIISYRYMEDIRWALKNKEIDCSFPEYEDPWYAEKDDLILTNPVLHYYEVFVYKGDYDSSLTKNMALAKKSTRQLSTANDFFYVEKPVVVETYFDCLKAVLNNKASSTNLPADVFYRLVNQTSEFSTLHHIYGKTMLNYSIAVSRDNAILCQILNKALATLNASELEIAVSKNSEVTGKSRLSDLFQDYFWVVSSIIGFFLLIITVIYSFFLRKTLRQKEEIEEKNKELHDKIKIIEQQKKTITIDALTQVNNRYQFERFIEKKIRLYPEAIKKGERLFLAMVDLDYFKKINDSFGHSEGDKALITVANVMKSLCINTHVFIARYGGDEFVIVSSNYEQLEDLCEGIQDRLKMESYHFPYRLHISYGIAEYTEEIETFEKLVSQADKILYGYKEAYHRAQESKWGISPLNPFK